MFLLCIIIGESFFKTKSRHIDKLQFNNGDDNLVFVARIENKKYKTIFNDKICISVYFKNYIYPDQFIGRFITDFDTVYRHPGHRASQKWFLNRIKFYSFLL